MKALLRDALENGAVGLSFGLIYTPSCYAETEELIELANAWFPEAECYVETRFFEDARVALREYLVSKMWLGTKVRNKHKAEILNKTRAVKSKRRNQRRTRRNKTARSRTRKTRA